MYTEASKSTQESKQVVCSYELVSYSQLLLLSSIASSISHVLILILILMLQCLVVSEC